MSNPAQLLLAEFEEWSSRATGNSGATVRGVDSTAESWRKMRHLAALIDEIHLLLTSMSERGSDVSVYLDTVPVWTQTLFAFNAGWKQAGEVDAVSLAHLRTLAERLTFVVPPLDQERIGEARQMVIEASKLLHKDTSVPEDLRRHLEDVLLHAADCISRYETVGDVRVRAAVDRLLAGLGEAAVNSNEQEKWTKLVNIFGGWFKNATGKAVEAGVTTTVQAMLGG